MEKVVTYADGSGRWFARVEFDEAGPQWLDQNIDRIRAKARRAIKREIAAREALSASWRCRIEVTAQDLNSLNQMTSITFGETI